VNVDYRGACCARRSRTPPRACSWSTRSSARAWPARAGLPFEHAIVVGGASRGALPWRRPPRPTSPRAPGRSGAERSGHGSGRHRLRALTSGTTGARRRDAEPQRVDPRGALGRTGTPGSATATCSTAACRCTTPAAWVAHVYRALVAGVPARALDRLFPCRLLGRVRHYGADADLHARHDAHLLWVRRTEPRRRRTQTRAPRGCVPMPDPLIDLRSRKRFAIERARRRVMARVEVLGMLQHRYDVHAAKAEFASAAAALASR